MRNLQIKGQNSHKLKLLIFVLSNRTISLSIAFGRRNCIGRIHLRAILFASTVILSVAFVRCNRKAAYCRLHTLPFADGTGSA